MTNEHNPVLLDDAQEDALDSALERIDREREAKACASTQVQVELVTGTMIVARAQHRVDTPEGKRGKYYRWKVSASDPDGDLVMLGTWDATVGQAQYRTEQLSKWSE